MTGTVVDQQPPSSSSSSNNNNKRRCSSSALPGEDDQKRRQRRPSSLSVQPLVPEEQQQQQPPKATTRKPVYSWSSTSSCFSAASSLTTVSTPVTTISTVTLLAAVDSSNNVLVDFVEDETDDINDQQQHENLWRRRVSRSLSRSASNGDAAAVQQILTDERWRPFLDIDAPDDERDGTTPLIYAACFGKTEVVRLLLQAGAKVDVQDKRGWTALMWATTNNHTQVVELLLDHGASFETRSARGRTAFDFVDSQNEQMLNVLSLRDSASNTHSLSLQQRMFRRHSAAPAFGRRHQELSAAVDEDEDEEEDPVDFYYMQHNAEQETEQHRTLMELGEEMDDLVSCEASMQSIHTFNWNKCLPDQMFVFSEENVEHILETAISRLTLPMKSRQEIYVPANIIFLSARFAHYYSSKELLNKFLDAAVFKIAQVEKRNTNDIHTLAFWLANLSQLLYYLKKDIGLVVATAEHQLNISELISEAYTFLVVDSQERINKIIEPAMLEHEPFEGLSEQVDFADDWHRFFRRGRNRRGTQVEACKESSTTSPMSSPLQANALRPLLSPQSVTSLLSSILYVLQSYEVHPAIILQAVAQLSHFLSCELFNRILSNKKYLCRSKALQIRMNVTAIEEWMRERQLPSHLTSYFNPLVQLLQLLQCVSQLNELELFVNTVKAFDLLNPLQIKRCVLNYRYEVSEPRLPDEIDKYVMQLARDTVRSNQRPRPSSYCEGTPQNRNQSTRNRGQERPTSVSSLGNLIMASMVGKISSRTAAELKGPEMSLDDDEESAREWTVEERDSRYMLPFSLPTTWSRKSISSTLQPLHSPTTAAAAEEQSICEVMCQELKEKMGTERERMAREERGIVPTIPEEWLDRLDNNMTSRESTQ